MSPLISRVTFLKGRGMLVKLIITSGSVSGLTTRTSNVPLVVRIGHNIFLHRCVLVSAMSLCIACKDEIRLSVRTREVVRDQSESAY